MRDAVYILRLEKVGWGINFYYTNSRGDFISLTLFSRLTMYQVIHQQKLGDPISNDPYYNRMDAGQPRYNGRSVTQSFQGMSIQDHGLESGASASEDLFHAAPPPYTYSATEPSSSKACSQPHSAPEQDEKFHHSYTLNEGNGKRSSDSTSVPRRASRSSFSDSDLPSPTDEQFLDQATGFTQHLPPPSYCPSPLPTPVAVPQTIPGIGQPFARAWAPSLSGHSITVTDFVEFIDNLNVVKTANPPLQILDLVGGVLGMVPHHWFLLAGIGVQAVAKIGTAAVSKGRTELYMRKVNREYFEPRGLKVAIASRDAMATAMKLPEGAGMLAPLTTENENVSMMERRLEGLRPYMAELDFDVPPPTQQTGILAKMSAGQVKRQVKKADKKAVKKRKDVFKEERKVSKDVDKLHREYEKEMKKLDKEEEKEKRETAKEARKDGGKKAEKAERKLEKELGKIEKERAKVERELEKKTGKETSKPQEKDKEVKQAKKVLWILIENI